MSPPFSDHDELTLAEVYSTTSFTATRTARGIFQITFATPQPNAYVVMLTIAAEPPSPNQLGTTINSIGFDQESSTGFTVYIGSGGSLYDGVFMFQCVSGGKTFCHGRVDVVPPPILLP